MRMIIDIDDVLLKQVLINSENLILDLLVAEFGSYSILEILAQVCVWSSQRQD